MPYTTRAVAAQGFLSLTGISVMLRNVSLFLAASLPLIAVQPYGERITCPSFEVSDYDIYVVNAGERRG